MADRELTYGEKLAGVTFNPSGDEVVAAIKQKAAEYMDEVDALAKIKSKDAEVVRMCEGAILDAQRSQMLAVKAATWRY